MLEDVNGMIDELNRIHASLVKFYEEQIPKSQPKEYKILSFVFPDNSKTYLEHRIFEDLVDKHEGKKPKYWTSDLDRAKIHSIGRVSDGEIFTLDNDISGFSFTNRAITRFSIENGKMLVYKNMGYSNLVDINHVDKPKYLFTAEDGVKIHEREHSHGVNRQTYVYMGTYKWDKKEWYGDGSQVSHNMFFSTEEKAKQYIEDNKFILVTEDGVHKTKKDFYYIVYTPGYQGSREVGKIFEKTNKYPIDPSNPYTKRFHKYENALAYIHKNNKQYSYHEIEQCWPGPRFSQMYNDFINNLKNINK